MAEDSFKHMIFAFVLIGLFSMLILLAVTNLGDTYEKDYDAVAGGSLSMSKFNDSISSFEQNSKDLKERFDKGSVWSAVAGVVVEGIFGIAKDMFDLVLVPYNLIANIMSDILHIPTFVTSVILGLLILSVIFGIWRLIKIGD